MTFLKIRKNRYLFTFLLTLAFLFSFSPFLTEGKASSEYLQLKLLYLNDFHGFAESFRPPGEKEEVGGIAYLAALVQEERRKNPSSTLLLSAGDMLQGHPWANFSKGESSLALMNEMGFEAMVVGNHEFNFGLEVLKERARQANFPLLGANVQKGGRIVDFVKPYLLKGISGYKVAIIGVTTPDIPWITHPRLVAGLEFTDPVKEVKRYIREIGSKAQLFIVLSHLGLRGDIQLAQEIKEIAVIVGGHTHSKIPEPLRIGKTLIVQAWEQAKALGVLDLTIKEGRIISYQGNLRLVKPQGEEDKKVAALVKKYKDKVDETLNQVIGRAEVDLNGEREKVRSEETNLGNLVADLMREVSGADVAMVNGGSIRASIKTGEIRAKDIYTALPFDNYLLALKLKGIQIKEALEIGISSLLEKRGGGFPQVSGLSFVFSKDKPKGARVEEVRVGERLLEAEKEYLVATNDFLAAGGDGYTVFKEAIEASKDFALVGGSIRSGKLAYNDPSRWLRDIFIEYIRNKGTIEAKVEGRIRIKE